MKKIFGLFIIVCVVFFLAGNFVYHKWFGNYADRLVEKGEPFGILFVGENDSSAHERKITFVCVMVVNPELFRMGFVSFLPQTKIGKDTPSMEKLILAGDGIRKIRETVSKVISIQVPFFIHFKVSDIARAIDLLEGLPYFLSRSDMLKGENLPVGEFLLDGSMVDRLLNIRTKADYVSVFQLYRYYSLILNAWKYRDSKWEILKEQPIFAKATEDINSNLSAKELFSMAKLFLSDDHWLPLFFEIPLKKEKGYFLLNREAAALHFRDFQALLTQKENSAFQQPPSIEVRNGTNVHNLAKKIRAVLSRRGFRVLEFTNADHHNYEKTILLDVSGKTFYLESVANALDIKKYYHVVNRTQFTDLILILGKDFSDGSINFQE